jgi:hypothetical protein
MTLATTTDLEARLGRYLTEEEEARAESILADVAASVRLYCGQSFVRSEHQLRSRVRRGKVRLPQRPVHEVVSVADRFGMPVPYTWDGIDTVHVTTRAFPGCAPVQVVDVVYDAGPDEVPAAIVGVVCSVALRTLGTDPTEGAVRSESIDGYSYTLGSTGGAGSFGLLEDEKRTLDVFRRVGGTIWGGP